MHVPQPDAPAFDRCDVCGRALDTATEVCPRCGVRPAARTAAGPRAPSTKAATAPAVSIPAAILALASAIVGSVVYLLLYPGEVDDAQAWGYALGWAAPLVIVAFLYLGRKLEPTLAAGIFAGAGMAQFFGWLPNVFLWVGASDSAWTWVSISSGVLAIAAGVAAAMARRRSPRTLVRLQGPDQWPAGPGNVAVAGTDQVAALPAPPPPMAPWIPTLGPTKACLACGHLLDPRAERCPACGSGQQPPPGPDPQG